METENTINDLRVDSFSCYLKPIEGVMFDASERLTRSYSNNRGALRKSSSGKRWFHGPCSNKKAVYVQQSVNKEDQFAFPILINKEKIQELPRMSIEVLGSGTINKCDITKTLLRKMSFLSWDAIPMSEESVVFDDVASDASSDLFEIENVSTTEWEPAESRCVSVKSHKKRDNGLLGCNSFKSVKVVEPVVYRTSHKSNTRDI